jgi:hypothetical protein
MEPKKCQKCKAKPAIKPIRNGFQFSCQCGPEGAMAVVGMPREDAIRIYNMGHWRGDGKKVSEN